MEKYTIDSIKLRKKNHVCNKANKKAQQKMQSVKKSYSKY